MQTHREPDPQPRGLRRTRPRAERRAGPRLPLRRLRLQPLGPRGATAAWWTSRCWSRAQAAPLYFAPGRWDRRYFQALRGRNYALRVHNRTDRRVGVLIAVDGLNVVNGERSKPAAQRGHVRARPVGDGHHPRLAHLARAGAAVRLRGRGTLLRRAHRAGERRHGLDPRAGLRGAPRGGVVRPARAQAPARRRARWPRRRLSTRRRGADGDCASASRATRCPRRTRHPCSAPTGCRRVS